MTEKYTPQKQDYIDLKGKKYLPARRRVQWFRGDHPDWTINTSVVDLDFAAGYAVIRAEVSDDTGRLIASGMKTETKSGFGDFVEKAETGAIARAVAIAGYGTEDALDLDEGERIADSPVSERSQPTGGERTATLGRRGASSSATTPQSAQYRRGELATLMAEHGLSTATVEVIANRIGIPKDERPMSDESMDRLIAAIEQPASGVPTTPGLGEVAGSVNAASPVNPPSDGQSSVPTDGPSADTAQPESSPASAAPALTDEQILAVTGGEIIPPAPGTPEYRALPNGTERARAKAYHDARKKGAPAQESLAEALGAPERDS